MTDGMTIVLRDLQEQMKVLQNKVRKLEDRNVNTMKSLLETESKQNDLTEKK